MMLCGNYGPQEDDGSIIEMQPNRFYVPSMMMESFRKQNTDADAASLTTIQLVFTLCKEDKEIKYTKTKVIIGNHILDVRIVLTFTINSLGVDQVASIKYQQRQSELTNLNGNYDTDVTRKLKPT